ncbi:MAG TPA: SDR family oxidoreductase [Blastococcus sp.]|jgi:gluconate 5-dehydrogenase|nr:SDR family oxidoreductase [Blastococcus sp.]
MDELQRFTLTDRVAIVAGGSGGVGVRTCGALAGVGAKVAIVGRSGERLAEARQAVEKAGGEALVIAGDMSDKAAADDAVQQTLDTFGRVDVLINGIGGGAGTALYAAEEYPQAEWDRILDLNLTTALLVSQAAARAMIAGGRGGSILNISSVRGQLGIDAGYSAYVAAKGAMDAVTRQHATEWAKHGIRVNAISPTFVRTAQAASLLADEDFYAKLVGRIPLRRIADPDDLVGALLFFCSDASSFVTGQILTLDGGLTATQ